jgi:hypothetical protein
LRDRKPPEKPTTTSRRVDLTAWLNTIFTFVLAVFAYEAWEESRKARDVFQGQLTAAQNQVVEAREAQRAWLNVEVTADSGFKRFDINDMGIVQKGPPGYKLTVGYKTRNIGHTPARAVVIALTYVIPSSYDPLPMRELMARQRKGCTRPNQSRDPRFRPPAVGSTVFPDEQSPDTDDVRIPLSEWPSEEIPTKTYLYLAGCVIYRSGEESKDHHTTFAYRVEPSTAGYVMLPTDPTTVGVDNMRLSKLRYADLLSAD